MTRLVAAWRVIVGIWTPARGPIRMEGYEEGFLSKEEGSSRSAVKRMTRKLELEMMKLTINAPDW